MLTGTVLSGATKVGSVIELPAFKIEKKIKSIQMFRKPVQAIRQGDRAGICVAQLDASSIERGLAAKPRTMRSTDLLVAVVKRVPYYMQEIKSKLKLHISMGH